MAETERQGEGGTSEDSILHHSGSKYVRRIRSCVTGGYIGVVDCYAILDALGNPPAPIAHALKKLMYCGLRKKGDRLQDLKEAIDAIKQQILFEENADGNGSAG